MIYYANPSHDPCYNQALEETLFHQCREGEILLLWRNAPAVVCGRYQNLYAEVSVPAAAREGITLIRRETGGGTVYHDEGNVNFTFITDYDGGGADYEKYLRPVVEVLRALGVPAQTGRVCDIAVEGKKISGSAQKIAGGRVLHHGTLLFSTDLTVLRRAANGGGREYVSRGVASSPWQVTNLQTYLPKLTVEEFQSAMLVGLTAGKSFEQRTLTAALEAEARRLAEEKYRAWDWTFGKNPAYTLTRQTPFGELVLESKGGVVQRLTLDGKELEAGQRLEPKLWMGHPLCPYIF